MTIELTDGHEVFLIRKISSYDELDRLRYIAKISTDGNLYWRISCI